MTDAVTDPAVPVERPHLASQVTAPIKLVAAKQSRRILALSLDEAKEEGTDFSVLMTDYPALGDLLAGLVDHAPYLWRLIRNDWARAHALLSQCPLQTLERLLNDTDLAWCQQNGTGDPIPESELMRRLRRLKQEAALLIALCDLGRLWSVEQVTAALSDFADRSLQSALRHLLAHAAREGRIHLPDPHDPAAGSGLVVLALGKHGARELNYSSDIDIVVLYDPAAAPMAERVEPGPFFVKLTQGLVRLIQERTADGYVFRTDLRLRPDPASTPIAISFDSAYAYYESVGQNWERAALIKARPVAGDLALGFDFIAALKPFIWRKYFDFAAIADIHAMKRQIHAVRGHETIAVIGHDIKLGRGGIREIEFFVQTQQLVFGGRRPQLRGQRTLDMLVALRDDGWISDAAVADLTASYVFLRMIEHRLQMREDEQTQRLPADEERMLAFARFCGYASVAAFGKALTAHALKVEQHYARLFEEGGELASSEGSLVFTGTTDDPDTLQTLRRLGFSNPPEVAETVRGWHFGRRQAVTSPRAREVLTELVPALLKAFGQTADPDAALFSFDKALGAMPAAVELFSILKSNDNVLRLFADVLGSAPRLAEVVAQRPHVLDAVIDPAFVAPVPSVAVLKQRLDEGLSGLEQFEDFLDRMREMTHHELFVIGARLLSGVLSPAQTGESYAALADAVIVCTLDEVRKRFEAEYGVVHGGQLAVVGLGRLGSRDMTATSDLDLVLLYDFDAEAIESSGPRPLPPTTYFGRLTQRLISALTVPTRRGTLYSVDMRLRPSGNKGPAATQFNGFVDYQASEAETWEQMALVRARVLAGDEALIGKTEAAIRNVLQAKRDPQKVKADALAMRTLIADEKGEDQIWDLKNAAGGLTDLEFLTQTLVLAHASEHPSLMKREARAIIEEAVSIGLIDANDGDHLITAHATMRDLFQWVRLTLGDGHAVTTASKGLKRQLAVTAGLPDFNVLSSHLRDAQKEVRGLFLKVMRRETQAAILVGASRKGR